MPNEILMGAEQAAFHRVFRRISQLNLYPKAEEIVASAKSPPPANSYDRGKKPGGKGDHQWKHQVSNLMNLSLAVKTPPDILNYLDHQAKRGILPGLYGALQQQFLEWKTALVPQMEKDILAFLGTKESPAKALLHLTRDGLLLEVFRTFCQHVRAHSDYLDATQGGH